VSVAKGARGPRPVDVRLRRLLVMLPWLMERGRVPLSEMAAVFKVGEKDLVRDLELASMCGIPPFLDEMVDVFIDDGWVEAGIPRLFTRPLRLTAQEGFSLLAAGQAAMGLPGADPSGPLARALAKLEAGLDAVGALRVDLARPPLLDAVTAAVERSERLSIGYWSAYRDAHTERLVEPLRVYAESGRWYVVVDDLTSGGERLLRIDRIESLMPTGERFTARAVDVPADPIVGDAEDVTMHLPGSAQWVVESYPTSTVATDTHGITVTLPITGDPFLVRLALRVGPEARVVAPTGRDGVVRDAARRLADRYRRPPALPITEG
jgi:predicted DNA-binding transcriptional regulator YafY